MNAAAIAADGTTPAEGMRLISKMANAARQINYTGTFVYKHGNQIETSRIWHLTDSSGNYERLEMLDGLPREIVRKNDEVTCYYPSSKTAKIEKWQAARRFPAVVSEQLSAIVANYAVRKGGIERVAGHDCQVTVLEPRDQLRYGHAFCAELKSGLPLRAKTLNDRGEAVEIFAFTQVDIGAALSHEHVKARYDATAPGWKLDQSALAVGGEQGLRWTVLNHPAGFRKVLEAMRTIHGKQAVHLVFSDGLAAVSIFVEPGIAGARAAQELSHQGAINVFTRPHAGHVVTALGEAPAATVMLFGNSVTLRAKP
jgi:sigma-E factor negative regulatory protein RseB